MSGLRCALMRGGTSKGAVFCATDLPADPAERDDLLLRVMGSPDPRQVDGLGGAHPLTSKVAVVSPSTDEGADVDYLFLQVVPDQPVVSTSQTCGNMLAAVAPFAALRGLVPDGAEARGVRVRLVNTGTVATVRVGASDHDGVPAPGEEARVEIDLDPPSGPLLPTGSAVDELAGLRVTCIDNGMPSVLVRAADLGVAGGEDPADLEADEALTARVRELRAAAVEAMGLDPDLEHSTVPKIVLVSAPAHGGTISTRSFIPVRVHQAIGVLGAASVAAAVATEGSVAHDLAAPDGDRIRVEHPTGSLELSVTPGADGPARTTVVRTARLIFDGVVHPAASLAHPA